MSNFIEVSIESAVIALENYETVYLSEQPRATIRNIEWHSDWKCYQNMSGSYTIENDGRVLKSYKSPKTCLQTANSRQYADNQFFLIEE